MINILCYGDSNTWGYDAKTRNRFPENIRWPGVLRKLMGQEFHVIEEGLCGRTTVWDDPIEGHKNGSKYLIPCLESHSPLDVVIIMLGTNDLKKRFSLSSFDIAAGAGELVRITMNCVGRAQEKPPKVLLVSPVHIGETINNSELNEMFGYEDSKQKSMKLAHYFKMIAKQYNCEFLDAAEIVVPTPLDAVHIDENEHLKLGAAIAQKVTYLLS